uniref:Phosphatidylinositol-3,4,5-trisphosphate 3-phosphatase n=1 Tax=Odontella aurita TaxID=265563 RepID=A0A7S4I4M9_9STRA
MAPKIKSPKALVSKKKRRYRENGFDLDLSYIAAGNNAGDGGDSAKRHEVGSKDVQRISLREAEADADALEGGQIIAMGFPAEGVSTLWRNPLDEVRRFLETHHPDRYQIYNLCSEPSFQSSLSGFDDSNGGSDDSNSRRVCHHFGFDDRTPPPIEMIRPFCASVHEWLTLDGANVAAVHCRAGKGRTGTMISCYLLHSGHSRTAEEALRTFGVDRTKNGRGVTIPSQMRYVHYYERVLGGFEAKPQLYKIERVRLTGGIPDFASAVAGGGCDPFLRISEVRLDENSGDNGIMFSMLARKEVVYDQRKHIKSIRHYSAGGDKANGAIDLHCSDHDVIVKGDVRLSLYHEEISWPKSKKKEMCRVWFHTGFVKEDGKSIAGESIGRCHILSFTKANIDWACKDKKSKVFDAGFEMEVILTDLQASKSTDVPAM